MGGFNYNSRSSQQCAFILVLVIFAILLVSESNSSKNFMVPTVHVSIVNEIADKQILTIHCKSKDDDLGEHKLEYGQDFHWKFHINLFGTTLYWCSMWWTDSNGRLIQGSFDTYKADRDWIRCGRHCKYPVRQDGVYGYWEETQIYKLVYPWPK
ncbi:Plant self-incompatibility S1 [Macleaya cordata]|uniref:S-protein homolog n=1 Tax=Macleaya cordata TaxID=56857 RepID=A0A200QJT9_MACCD|nr:Plant self-incompatibility S1 [Macleaya cordata]